MKKKQRRKSKASTPPHVGAYFSEFPNPFADLSPEEREAAIEHFVAKVESEHSAQLATLEATIRTCNPLHTLAHFAFYDRLFEDVQKGEKYTPVLQHSVELLQAYFLTLRSEEIHVSEDPIPARLQLNATLKSLERTFPLQGFAKGRKENEEARSRSLLEQELRIHTHGVRNAGYYRQVMAMLRGVSKPLDDEFFAARGVTLTGLVRMNENILKVVEERVNAYAKLVFSTIRRRTPDECVNAYCSAFGHPEEVKSEMLRVCRAENLSAAQAHQMCVNDSERQLPTLYLFTLDDFVEAYGERVERSALLPILGEWSLAPEALASSDKSHFFLDNPVWTRPLVKVGAECFFWPLVELFHSFGMEMLEAIIRPLDTLWRKYQDPVRAQYLEKSVAELCHEAFPGAAVFRGLIWRDNTDDTQGETDVLALFDSIAVIIECKSGRITPQARRGSPDRLRREIRKLIEDASAQSQRFAEVLSDIRKDVDFFSSEGHRVEINRQGVKRVVRLNVTLDYFGPLACAVREMVDAKLLSSTVATAPTLSLVDFEMAIDLLERPVERLHYFARRGEVEKKVSLMAGEEDLVACYLATGLNLGELEDECGDSRLNLGFMHTSVRAYMMSKERGDRAQKPKRRYSAWWRSLLDRLQGVAFSNWCLAAFNLLDVRYDDQVKFEKGVRKLLSSVPREWQRKGHLSIVVGTNGPASRRTAVAAVVLQRKDPVERERQFHDAIDAALNRGAKSVLIFCLHATDTQWPYSSTVYFDPELEN